MSEKTELERKEILRLSNEESNLFTKECIETALLILMKEKDFKAISITDIVKRAGVSRSAYYRNYSSKEDILNKHLKTVIQMIMNSLDFKNYHHNDLNFWLPIFKRIRPHSDKLLPLLNAGFDGVILTNINQTILDNLAKQEITSAERYEVLFWIGAFFNLLTEWVTSGKKESDEEMAKICHQILNNFPKKYDLI